MDFEEEGPAKILGYIANRFAPEAMYIQAGLRAVFMVADLNEEQMMEMMLIVSKQFDTYPEFTPVFPGNEISGIVVKAIDEVKKAQL